MNVRRLQALAWALATGLILATGSAAASEAARSDRHALIIGVGRYAEDPARPVPALGGVAHDMLSARTMAERMGVPAAQTVVLQDAAATRAGVLQALQALQARVKPGDRVFVYWSGHGSRYLDAQAGGCVETLIPHDLKDFSHAEFARLLKPVGDVAGKLFVVYDACHSGGATAQRTLGPWRPKTAGVSAQCSLPSNVRSRSLAAAAVDASLGLADVVHIASARPDEVSFDHAERGGLATVALRQCFEGDARDLDGSGAVSADELVACAQRHVEQALAGQPGLLPHHLTIAGNRAFVPAGFRGSAPPPAPDAAALPTPDFLDQIVAQADSQRQVRVRAERERLKIGSDALSLAVASSHAGWVYIAMAGSDGQVTLLFPNALDAQHRIGAGQTLVLPRPAWRLVAGGPPGTNRLLVAVTDRPRDPALLAGAAVGPFMLAPDDVDGRRRLQQLLADTAFGAARLDIHELR
ncbi:MAG: caspase family protein [Burkholderiaceae bacterium]|nr:caspase family protein [Rhodoferax sp.]MCP5283564.1 caspase family protein [Burkholderiaceae bacterium]